MTQSTTGVSQHKRLAMGEKVTGMKKGGSVKHDDVAEDRRMVKQMVKSEALTGKANGGIIARPRVTSILPRVPAVERPVVRPAPRLVRMDTRPAPALMKKGGGAKERAEHETPAEQRAEGKKGERAEMKRGGAAKRCMKCGGAAHGGRCK